MSEYLVADLHCDLLCYLAGDLNRTPYDLVSKCSIPQLMAGHVKLQVMAIFVETSPGSLVRGTKQMQAFQSLSQRYFNVFETIQNGSQFDQLRHNKKIGVMPAIENASALCEEKEDLDIVLNRFTEWQNAIGPFAYVSLTWNGENRFGGGAHSKVGLKSDGKRLLEYLCEKRIPIDFSHTSDYLAYDIIDFLEGNNLQPPVLASHSNMRTVRDVPRNLPDDIAKEILRRQGIIGMNFYRDFLGDSEEGEECFIKQLEHFFSLGAQKQTCFGADFFYPGDLPVAYQKDPSRYFFPSSSDASCYGRLLDLWHQYGISSESLQDIAFNNIVRFLHH